MHALEIAGRLSLGLDGRWVDPRSLIRGKPLFRHGRLLDKHLEVVVDRLRKIGGRWWLRLHRRSQVDLVRPWFPEGQIVFKRVGELVSQGKVYTLDFGKKMFECGGNNGAVIVNSAIDRSGCNIRRNQNRGDTYTEAREIKRW